MCKLPSTVEVIAGLVSAVAGFGGVENAKLIFEDLSEKRYEKNKGLDKLNDGSLLSKASKALDGGDVSEPSGFFGTVGAMLKGLAKNYVGKKAAGFFDPSDPRIMNVQFNPASINISNEMGDSREVKELPVKTDDKKNNDDKKEIVNVVRPVTETFAVTLLMASAEKGDDSVRRRAEVFLEAANKASPVAFAWGNMQVVGCISDLNVEYTMFDSRGEPIRASVELTLQNAWEEKVSSKVIDKAVKTVDKEVAKADKQSESSASAEDKVVGKFK